MAKSSKKKRRNMSNTENDDVPTVSCPHCENLVVIDKINCGIFRHGIVKATGKQINPHASKEICDHYAANDLIYGCGKPFRIIVDTNSNKLTAIVCEYI